MHNSLHLEFVTPGQAYVFIYNSGTNTWDEEQILTGLNLENGDYFGCKVAISYNGDRIIIGATYDNEEMISSGAAYVFTRSGTTWTEINKIKKPNPATNDCFGESICLAGDGKSFVIGAHQSKIRDGLENAGELFVYC